MSLIQAAQQEIAERKQRIVSLRQQLELEEEEVRRAEMVLAFLQGRKNLSNDESNSRPTIGNLIENLLRNAREPMHVNDILRELDRNGLPVTRKTLLTTVKFDKRKRFINLGDSMIDLNPSPLEFAPRLKRDNMNLGLLAAIRDVLPSLSGKEFNVRDVRDIIIKNYPNVGEKLKDNYASLSAMLNRMAKQGELQRVKKGVGSEPNLYKKVT